WMVLLSRWLPLMPEVVACMAGVARMRARVFFPALACGTVPMAFIFAWVGRYGREEPVVAVVLSIVIPVILWGLFRLVWGRGRGGKAGRGGGDVIGD
ncbi:MAG: hypothetical protein AAF591_23015, partial [Verrucomicrobiota bacterium]